MASKKLRAARKYHHGDLRRAVMDAALQITAESGLESLSLREIARKIGVTSAAPYHHFKDRETLLLDLAIEAYGKLLDALSRTRATAPNPEAEVVAAVARYLRFGREHRAEYAIMFAGEYATHPRVGEMVSIANACLDLFRASIADASHLGERESAERPFAPGRCCTGFCTSIRRACCSRPQASRKSLPCKASWQSLAALPVGIPRPRQPASRTDRGRFRTMREYLAPPLPHEGDQAPRHLGPVFRVACSFSVRNISSSIILQRSAGIITASTSSPHHGVTNERVVSHGYDGLSNVHGEQMERWLAFRHHPLMTDEIDDAMAGCGQQKRPRILRKALPRPDAERGEQGLAQRVFSREHVPRIRRRDTQPAGR
jgi:AcrR family transcriptional regulator